VRGARDAQPHGVRRPHADRGDARAVQRQERVERFLRRRRAAARFFVFVSLRRQKLFVRRVSPPPRNVTRRRDWRLESGVRFAFRAFRRAERFVARRRRLGRRGAARREGALQEVDLERRELRLQAPGRDVFRVRGRRGHRTFRALVRDFARVDDDGHLDLARQLLEHLGARDGAIERLLHLRALAEEPPRLVLVPVRAKGHRALRGGGELVDLLREPAAARQKPTRAGRHAVVLLAQRIRLLQLEATLGRDLGVVPGGSGDAHARADGADETRASGARVRQRGRCDAGHQRGSHRRARHCVEIT
jgi:hypothetical protein